MYKNNNNQIKTNITPFIFTKKTNSSYKLVPFNLLVNHVGKTKYLPPVSKEWKNSVYNYYTNNTINYPVYDLKINSLIKAYFGLYFNHKFAGNKFISRKKKRISFNRIFISKPEIKHTNDKALITLYVYNKERFILLRKIKKLKKYFLTLNINRIINLWLKFISVFAVQSFISFSNLIGNNNKKSWVSYLYLPLLLKYNNMPKNLYLNDTYYRRTMRLTKTVNRFFTLIRRLKLKLSLNKYKFEDKLLYKLSLLLSQYYGKKVEFNIVNLKSIAHNSDIFTEILTLKLKKDRSNPMFRMNTLLAKIRLSEVNTIIERGRVEKQVDFNLVENKYNNLNINNIINQLSENEGTNLKASNFLFAQSYKDNLNKLLYSLYYKTILSGNLNLKGKTNEIFNKSSSSFNKAYYLKLRNIIFENIKYKNMGGARLRVKGRLTRRYRADRAVYKLKWKGGLKNIDSSFKGLSTVMFRGYLDSNIEISKLNSKRRIGSFAVKGWFKAK